MLTDTVLKILTENRGQFVSGQALARQAGVTRAAVWKSIQALQSRGFAVTAAPRCGYRLEPGDDVRPGDVAEIFGQSVPIEIIAGQADTIQYELLCAVSPRVPRLYL